MALFIISLPILLILFILLISLIFLPLSLLFDTNFANEVQELKEKAIESECAQFNPKNGEFEWIYLEK